MGGEQSKRKQEIVDLLKGYLYKDKYSMSEQQFVEEVFYSLDQEKIDVDRGPILMSGMYVLRRFYSHLLGINRGTLSKKRAIQIIENMYEDRNKTIQHSYAIIKSDSNPKITKNQFVDYVMACLEQGINSILKYSRSEKEFGQCFRLWIKKNTPAIVSKIEEMFTENAQSQKDVWTLGDFKRWILNRKNWSLYVQIKGKAFNIPLNVPCLLGMDVKMS